MCANRFHAGYSKSFAVLASGVSKPVLLGHNYFEIFSNCTLVFQVKGLDLYPDFNEKLGTIKAHKISDGHRKVLVNWPGQFANPLHVSDHSKNAKELPYGDKNEVASPARINVFRGRPGET